MVSDIYATIIRDLDDALEDEREARGEPFDRERTNTEEERE